MMSKEKKIYIRVLANVGNKPMEEIFEREFNRWKFENTSEAKIESTGMILTEIEIGMILVSTKASDEKIIINDISKDGIPLTKKLFIKEEIRLMKPYYEKSIGSKLNRASNYKLKSYIDFLQEKEREILGEEVSKGKNEVFENDYSKEQIKLIHSELNKRYYKANIKDIECLLSNKYLEKDYVLNWIDKAGNNVDFNKLTLFDFFEKFKKEIVSENPYKYFEKHILVDSKKVSKNALKQSYSDWNKKKNKESRKNIFEKLYIEIEKIR